MIVLVSVIHFIVMLLTKRLLQFSAASLIVQIPLTILSEIIVARY